ncbi:MAG: terminase family protein [Thiotrichales bacterium]|nr:terminase family protein [Thiotrichales bacterium]
MRAKTEEQTIYTQKQTRALGLYLQQRTPAEIAEDVCVTARAVQRWISKYKWNELRDDSPAELVMRQRIAYLMWVDEKSQRQLNELDMLLKHQFGDPKNKGGKAKDGSNRGRPSNKVKNDVSGITKEMLDEFREKTFFYYQLNIWQTKQNPDLNWMRFYLKSRQIGLTYYFAYEAFEDAILTGDNQIFLSASKKQSEIFKTYIRMFALKIGEVDLKGKDEITLSNGATFYFLSTNSRTAQGYHGHLYVDEVFWIPRFKELDDLAGGMSIHDKWRTTYLSTPSTIAHEAYAKWAGSKKDNIDISHKALKGGSLGADGIYRQIITVDDAIEGGATFFNMDKLKKRYPDPEVFDNLLRCKFLDDSKAVFKLKALMACKVESKDWKDVNFDAYRPVGNHPVWIGYDPSGEGDEAAVIVALPPARPGSAFRLVEKIRLQSESYQYQADRIKELCERFNVTEIAMDTTGIGDPVSTLVQDFFPGLTKIIYSINTKSNLVYKAREVITNGRLQFDGEWDDVVHSFLMIKRVTTGTGKSTFGATRTKDSSHADIAMAIMNLLSLEDINENEDGRPTVSFSQ